MSREQSDRGRILTAVLVPMNPAKIYGQKMTDGPLVGHNFLAVNLSCKLRTLENRNRQLPRVWLDGTRYLRASMCSSILLNISRLSTSLVNVTAANEDIGGYCIDKTDDNI